MDIRKITGAGQVVADELARIAKANRGQITPEAVVKNAASERSPIHDCFTWDDTAAARKCRLMEAAQLIRSVKVLVEMHPQDKPRETRAFVNVSLKQDGDDDSGPETCYVPLQVALEVEDYRTQMLENALRDLAAFRRKYAILKELSGVFDEVEKLQGTLKICA